MMLSELWNKLKLFGSNFGVNQRKKPLLKLLQPTHVEDKSIQLSQELEQLIEQTRKQQAVIQVHAIQKVEETADWWLFGSAFTSAAAAIAGILSVRS